MTEFTNEFSKSQWKSKYQFGDEQSIDDTFSRVAGAIASVEEDKEYWTKEFYNLLEDFKFVPGGRIISNAGAGLKGTTLINCYVEDFVGKDRDSIEGIYTALLRQAKTLQSEGGYGFCANTMRPRGANIEGIGNQSPGAIKFLELWDKSSEIITAGSGKKAKKGEKNFIRKGAQMVTMSVWHPDIIEFITAKQEPGRLTKFNMSVLITDDFMKAVEEDLDWNLEYPDYKKFSKEYKNFWDGDLNIWQVTLDEECTIIYKTLKARELWKLITESTYNRNEPGVLFIDTINKFNNLRYCEYILASNPCAEQVMGPHSVCDLGSTNLVHYIDVEKQDWDYSKLKRDIPTKVRFLDNVLDVTLTPLPEQKESAITKRRIGLGIFGYASALMMMDVAYGSKQSLELTEKLLSFFYNQAYQASAFLAKEKGPFKLYKEKEYLNSKFIQSVLTKETIDLIKKYGIRNSHLGSIQPTGNSSVFANLISSGCEPIFDKGYYRTFIVDHPPENLITVSEIDWINKTYTEVEPLKGKNKWTWTKEGDENILITEFEGATYKFDKNRGLTKEEWVEDYAISFLKKNKKWDEKSKAARFAMDLSVDDHINVLAVMAKYVDASISKTINCPNDYPYEEFKDVYFKAWKNGIKGVTTYREGTMTNVLSSKSSKKTGIDHTQAPKRPKELECDVHHITVKSQPYFVLVGLYDGEPYEVFAGKNGVIGKKVKKGKLIKQGRSRYKAIFDDDTELSPIGAFTSDEEDCVTRLISTALRHGAQIDFVTHQLEKAKGDLQSYSKCIARALKKYIEEGAEVKGDECPDCKGRLVRKEGCISCIDCGYSKCG